VQPEKILIPPDASDEEIEEAVRRLRGDDEEDEDGA
jgi:hypothetical protein